MYICVYVYIYIYIYIYIYLYIRRRLINPIRLPHIHVISAKSVQVRTRVSCGTGEPCKGSHIVFPANFLKSNLFFAIGRVLTCILIKSIRIYTNVKHNMLSQHVCRGLWAVGCGLWAVGRGPWAVGRGPWAVSRGSWAVGRGPWAVGCGLWAVSCGLWAVGCGLWAVGCGLWAVGCGLCAVGCGPCGSDPENRKDYVVSA